MKAVTGGNSECSIARFHHEFELTDRAARCRSQTRLTGKGRR
jgi:hypothetical protein